MRSRGALAIASLRGGRRRSLLWESAKFAAIAILTAVAVLLVLDWVLFETRVVAPRLPLEDDGSPSDKLLLAARYPDVQVLHLGDSRVLYGIHPVIVSRECGCGGGFNGAFSAADLRLTGIMADRLLQKLSPKLVLIGVSQWDLSDAADIHVWGPAPELVPPWQLGEFGVSLNGAAEMREVLGAGWRLYKYRGELREALDPWSDTDDLDDPRRGFDEYRARRRLRAEDLEFRHRQWFTDFSIDGRRTEALRELLADLRGRGVQVVLVAPPMYPGFYDRVRGEVAMFRTAVEQIAREHGAAFEDVTDPGRIGLTSENFRDVVHLDEEGAERLSRHAGRVIRALVGAE